MNAQFFTHDLPHLMGYYATHPIAPFLSAPAALMNGILMSAGIDALSVPAAKAQEFNENMVRFYLTKDATEMMAFLLDCHPEQHEWDGHDAIKLHRARSIRSH
jgi:hypothetical protein